MIGNDIVDLVLAQYESNWERTGFLDKLFSIEEQKIILNSQNPTITVWNLWSRKEAAYKIYNRQTGIRAYNPLALECIHATPVSGKVICGNHVYYTKTKITSQSIHTIAVCNQDELDRVLFLNDRNGIKKENGIPSIGKKIVSISAHGRFRRIVTLSEL